MATIAKICLSGTPADGRPVGVSETASSGQLIHTGPSVAADYDEIWLWASNIGTVTETLVLQWGGVTSVDALVTTINPAETVLVAPGWLLKGNASTELIVRAYTTTDNAVNIQGYVNRIDAA